MPLTYVSIIIIIISGEIAAPWKRNLQLKQSWKVLWLLSLKTMPATALFNSTKAVCHASALSVVRGGGEGGSCTLRLSTQQHWDTGILGYARRAFKAAEEIAPLVQILWQKHSDP